MKTTLDLSAPLLEEAKAVAARERTTLRELVEEGMRAVLARKRSSQPFRLRDASFKGGRGLHPEFAARFSRSGGLVVRNPLLADVARERGPCYGRRARRRA